MVTVSSTDARNGLPGLLDRVAQGEEVTITRHGRPVAVVVSPDALATRRAGQATAVASRIRTMLDNASQAPLAPEGALDGEWADELIAEVRAGRDRN